jgi:AcrR family transcriptional regulator
MPRTPDVGEDRREQIIDAAMRVFAQKGFTRATNRDVAHEAGITSGLIYYYFENKEALLQAVLEERSPMKVVATIPAEMMELPPETFLPMIVLRVLDIVENEQFVGLLRVMLPEVLHNPTVAPFMSRFIQRILGFLSSYLQRQMAKGTLRNDLNLDVTGQMLVGTVITFVLRRQIVHDTSVLHYTHEELAHAIVNAMLQGIIPR